MSRRRVPAIALVLANAVSLAGSNATMIAIPWYVLVTTGSPVRVGVTAGVAFLGEVLSGLFASALVDRIGLRRASVLADIFSGLFIAAIPTLAATIGLPFWLLLVLVFARAVFDTPGNSARTALAPPVAAASGISLERLNSFYASTFHIAALVGAPAAGLAIAAIGPTKVLWLDAASFACSALLIGGLVPAAPRPDKAAASYLREIWSGLTCILRDRLVLTIALTIGAINFLDSPLTPVLLPLYSRASGSGASMLGFLVAALAVGGLLGSLAYVALGMRLPRRATFNAAFVLLGVSYTAVGLARSPVLAGACLFMTGFASGPLNPILATAVQEAAPPAMLARVFGATRALAFSMTPLGTLAGGAAADRYPVRGVIAALGIATLAVVLASLFNPALTRLRRSPA